MSTSIEFLRRFAVNESLRWQCLVATCLAGHDNACDSSVFALPTKGFSEWIVENS